MRRRRCLLRHDWLAQSGAISQRLYDWHAAVAVKCRRCGKTKYKASPKLQTAANARMWCERWGLLTREVRVVDSYSSDAPTSWLDP